MGRRGALAALSGALLAGCHSMRDGAGASIEFTRIPQADPGGQEKNDIIEGVVKGARRGTTTRVVCPERQLVGAAAGSQSLHYG